MLLLVADAAGRDGTARLMADRPGTVVATVAGQNATWPAALPKILFDQGATTALLMRAAGGRLTLLLPSGPLAAASLTPPLLLTFADDALRRDLICMCRRLVNSNVHSIVIQPRAVQLVGVSEFNAEIG